MIAYERSDNSLVVDVQGCKGILHRDGNLIPHLHHERGKLKEAIISHKDLLPLGWLEAAAKLEGSL